MVKIDLRYPPTRRDQQYCAPGCKDELAPICGSDCKSTISTDQNKVLTNPETKDEIVIGGDANSPVEDEGIKELLVIGSGPHSLTLLLRLLEPEADLLTDNERHKRSAYTKRQRPISEVRKHTKQYSRGPSVILKQKKKISSSYSRENPVPAPLSLETIRNKCLVVDGSHDGGWMTTWKHNFESIGIPHLRSPFNAHADPYDHRALEFYAQLQGRDDELILLPHLQKATDFIGPYNAPSTSLFHDFHDDLARAYGIQDIVQSGTTVQSIRPIPTENNEAVFEVTMKDYSTNETNIVKAKRVVCAMGPQFRPRVPAWESSLRTELGPDFPHKRILHTKEIIKFIKLLQSSPKKLAPRSLRLLVVGGGMTSAQLTLLAAKSPWCKRVTLLQRSKSKERQFDLEPKWMGPLRGKFLDSFWSLPMEERADFLKSVRQGGSIPPELLRKVAQQSSFVVKEQVEVSSVEYQSGEFIVNLDDGSLEESYDMIWLSTGSQISFDQYPALACLQESIPVELVKGLPVLNNDLSWGNSESEQEEPLWKQSARKNLYCLGVLAGMELGPDALNLMGARHGAVRVAQAIRKEME